MLDSRFMIASDLQSLFRDKDTGLPLRNGKIYFWKDQARAESKDVYKLSGSPPNYSYTNLGAVIDLTSSGTVSDNDNDDIILYYFPYEGTPEELNKTVELYFVQVYSEGGVEEGILQFTREAWPNFSAETVSAQVDFTNYIPNGQFLIHNNIPPDALHEPPYVEGEIRQDVTDIAQGGWTFERKDGVGSKEIVTFNEFDTWVGNPTASPKYYINVTCDATGILFLYKQLSIKFNDVNKFATENDLYSFGFSAQTDTGLGISASIVLIKYYGIDGSTTEETTLANITITSFYTTLQASGFAFGSNEGKVIGVGNYVQLAIRFPLTSSFSVDFTDFVLTPGNVIISSFPQTPDADFKYKSINGWTDLPDYNGMNLYLTQRLTLSGMVWDTSEIGDSVFETQTSLYTVDNNSLHTSTNRMLANGHFYLTLGYSHLGIPFARLQANYWIAALNLPRYGTGSNFVTLFPTEISGAATYYLTTNKPGVTTDAADGMAPFATGFTITKVHTGATYNVRGLYKGSTGDNEFFIQNNLYGVGEGAPDSNSAGDSGFTFLSILSDSIQKQLLRYGAVAATGLAGLYFKFSSTTTKYYVWFKVNTVGSDPMIADSTGIEIDLLSTMTDTDVRSACVTSVSGFQLTTILFLAASVIPPGAYWTFSTVDNNYYVWYFIDGEGDDPEISGKIGIKVTLPIGSETTAQVATATQIAINSIYFAAPDWRGYFPRAWNNGSNVDPDANFRFSNVPGVIGDVIGTGQFEENQIHQHDINLTNNTNIWRFTDIGGTRTLENEGEDDTRVTLTPTSDNEGGAESRPVNAYINWAIKY